MAVRQTQTDLTSEIIRRGQPHPAPGWTALRCGLLEAEFDPATGWLRRVRVGSHEVIRAIYGALRDRNWGTVPSRLHQPCVDQGSGAFRVSFEVECVAPNLEFRWHGAIIGEENGVLTFHFAGEALTGFWKNRIGLCVLHPLDACVGQPCAIETIDGAVLDTMFPRLIAPQQPFKNVRAISHEVAPGVRVEVRFDGELFETEDQRNWTDASFKTYSTPLDQPFPVWIERATRVEQSVTVRLVGAALHIASHAGSPDCPELSATGEARPRPPIGFGMASHGAALTSEDAARLRQLRPAHLRLDLRLSDDAWPARWRQAGADAAAVGATLHVAVFLSKDPARELAALAAELSTHPLPVSLWLIFPEDGASTEARLVRMAEAVLPVGALLAAGTDADFEMLNRARFDPAETALPCFSLNPQVHAFDDASLIENLSAQAATIESAREFSRRPIVISPITLRPRFNAAATTEEVPAVDVLPPQVDPRQMSLFGAAWTVGSLARLAPLEGIHSLTYYETTGWRGVIETAGGSPLPALFPSLPGGVFPMFHVFAGIAEGERIIPTRSTHPMRFDGFCVIEPDDRRRWIVANLTALPQEVRVITGGQSARVSILDETNAALAMREPDTFGNASLRETPSGRLNLELRAYAIAQISVET